MDTIASWSLRLLLAYISTSEWSITRPQDNQEWNGVYGACEQLIQLEFIRRIIRCSYGGLYVDEYQDCTREQHALIASLSRDLPCRILGDPLQAIFDFGGQECVDWEGDVVAQMDCLGELSTPYRWLEAGRPHIGTWLGEVRKRLLNGANVNLTGPLPDGVVARFDDDEGLPYAQRQTCLSLACDPLETVAAIHKGGQPYKQRTHTLAKQLARRGFSSIEEIEGRELFRHVERIDAAPDAGAGLRLLIGFASTCMTAVKENLSAATTRGEHAPITAKTKNPELTALANSYLDQPGPATAAGFLAGIENVAGVYIARRDLLRRMLASLRKQQFDPSLSLSQAAEQYQTEFRWKGRPTGRRKIITTTLLAKGLEFDHAIVLDASSLTRKELYVAMTRGAKSLTIISTSQQLDPQS